MTLDLRRIRRLVAAGAAVVLTLLLAACDDDGGPVDLAATVAPLEPPATPTIGPATEATVAVYPVTVVDSGGTEFVFESAPSRIISFSPGATEILFAIGAGDQVIAADEFSDHPPATAALERVQYSNPDPEVALALDPDLVLFATNQETSLAQFRGLDLRVMLNREPASVEGVLENIELLGRITGHVGEAEELAAAMRATIDAFVSALDDVEEGPIVFFELSDGLYTVAPDTFVGGMLSLLKARNIAEGAISQFPQLTAEAVIAADPEVILLADAEFGASLESLRERPGWSDIEAVRTGAVHPIDPDLSNRPGPRIVEAIEAMMRALYPELFE
jgi:iron complex transport system substrate-binding protein